MSHECQILFLMVLICMAIPLVSSDEDCERSEIKKEWSVTCDSQTHQRDYCIPGQRVNDPCSSDNVCDYCPEGQFQNVYTNCKTCKNCTTLDHCCPGQVLTRNCTSVKDAKCGCPVCPEEHTPTTCPTVCNKTNQTSTSDGTPVSSLSSDNPNVDTTSWIPSSDTDGTTSSPTSAKDTLSSGCKCVGWKIGFAVAVLLCVILFGVVVCLCLKDNGATSSKGYEAIRGWTRSLSVRRKRSNDCGSEDELSDAKDKDTHQLGKSIAEPESVRIQQSKRSKKGLPDSVDAVYVIQKDKTDAGSTSQQSSLKSAHVESDRTTVPPEHRKEILNQDLKKPGHELAAMDRVVSSEDIEELSQKIGDSWGKIGKALGLSTAEIENIRYDYKKQQEVANQILLTWKQKNGNSATYRVLVNALRSADRKDLGDDLEKKVNDPAAETDLLQ